MCSFYGDLDEATLEFVKRMNKIRREWQGSAKERPQASRAELEANLRRCEHHLQRIKDDPNGEIELLEMISDIKRQIDLLPEKRKEQRRRLVWDIDDENFLVVSKDLPNDLTKLWPIGHEATGATTTIYTTERRKAGCGRRIGETVR